MQPHYRLGRYRGKFAVVWSERGRTRRLSLGVTDRAEASELFVKAVAELTKGDRPKVLTVEYVWNEYRKALGAKPAATTMQFEWKAIGPHFGAMSATAIQEADCRAYIAKRRALGRSDGTARTELGRLRSALSWAAKRDLIHKAPPILLPPSPPPRDKRMTRAEVARFLDACDLPHVRLFCHLAIATGARMGAILGLTWDRVDLKAGRIKLADSEIEQTNKRRAEVPIGSGLLAALKEAQAASTCRYVIEWGGKRVGSVKKGIATAGGKCGLPWVTAHVFRHSAACLMAESGTPMSEIAQFLGHTNSRTTEAIYARYSPEYLRKAADALEFD